MLATQVNNLLHKQMVSWLKIGESINLYCLHKMAIEKEQKKEYKMEWEKAGRKEKARRGNEEVRIRGKE